MITILHALSHLFRPGEREDVQRKTFTRWINAQLNMAERETIQDLFTDLRDGTRLLSLVKLLALTDFQNEADESGQHGVNDLDSVFYILENDYNTALGNISPSDIRAGSPQLTLALVWIIIVHWQVKVVMANILEEMTELNVETTLLNWCHVSTHRYKDVHVTDLTTSWQNGMAFNALIHFFRPDLFNYKHLLGRTRLYCLNHAFDVANNKLGVAKLLDAEDMENDVPDKKSMITYLMCLFQALLRSNQSTTSLNNNQLSEVVSSKFPDKEISVKLEILQLANNDLAKNAFDLLVWT